jgi:hypothetical protein
MIFGLAPKSSTEPAGGNAVAMAYIVTKQNRFYVVTYDGIDPNTGRERRRWHLAGNSRDDAETIAANLTHRTEQVRAGACSAATVTSFVTEVWMTKRVQHLRPSTAHRYRWMIDNYITPDHRSSTDPIAAGRTPRTPLRRSAGDGQDQRNRARPQDRL